MNIAWSVSTDTSANLLAWAERLKAISEPVVSILRSGSSPERVSAFCDEQGARREVDRLALARVLGVNAARDSADARVSGDVLLWRSLHSGQLEPGTLLAPDRGQACPLVHHREGTTIEVWTEVELSALHALWNCARVLERTDLRQRALDAAAWHVLNTQPDNATNHAWATHVFAALGALGDAQADLYAQTLVHNCCVATGRPDLVSAIALRDGANELYAAATS